MVPAPAAPSLEIHLDGDWSHYTRLLPKDCEVFGVVTIAGDGHGAPGRLAATGTLMKKDTGGEVTMLNQNRGRMKLEFQQHSPASEMMEVD